MFVLGITGGSGSGKSHICKILSSLGYYIVDADKIAREIVCPGQPAFGEICLAFGQSVIAQDGTLERKTLGRIVFSDPDKLQALNKITHKYIIECIKNELQGCCAEVCVIDAPLLYECGLESLCDAVIGVTASRTVRINRIVARDHITNEDAVNRIDAQKNIENSLQLTDMIIDTTHNPSSEFLANAVTVFIKGANNE